MYRLVATGMTAGVQKKGQWGGSLLFYNGLGSTCAFVVSPRAGGTVEEGGEGGGGGGEEFLMEVWGL